MSMRVLVTGGAGYIGSHTCVVLLEAGHEVVILDNLSNSSMAAINRVQEIAGKSLTFVRGDVRNVEDVGRAIEPGVDAVIHFAALKAVGESCERPIDYYEHNVSGSISLLKAIQRSRVRRIVFSSSAAVYGEPASVPVTEDAPIRPASPYGRTKAMVEDLIRDYCNCEEGMSAVLLRYFNPVGAHVSGRIGEQPCGKPNNLMPYIAQVAVGQLERLHVFGDDYPTPDGTGVRDYIHVVDLAIAHLKALQFCTERTGVQAFNLGAGKGYSVFELVAAFESVSGRMVPYQVVRRRPGDVASLWADCARAREVLGWKAQRDLISMCRDVWRWQMMNPLGYQDETR